MATQLQIRRGTSTQVAAFTGAEGEIVVNTTNDSVHVNDGSTAGGFEMARADLNNVSDTDLNAALTGNTVSALTVTALTTAGVTTTGDISFGDNDKAIFGAGSDLQIYHDGNHSYVTESGAGDLYLRGANIWLQNSGPTATYAKFTDGGAVELRYNDAPKLVTTSTGIDVTDTLLVGTDSGDAFNAHSKLRMQNNDHAYLQIKADSAKQAGVLLGDTDDDFVGGMIYDNADNTLQFTSGNTERMRFSGGNLLVGVTNAGATGLSLATNHNVSFSEGANLSFANVFRQTTSGATVIGSGYKHSSTANLMASSHSSAWARTAISAGYGAIRFFADAESTIAVGTDITPTERFRITSTGSARFNLSSTLSPESSSTYYPLFIGSSSQMARNNHADYYWMSNGYYATDASYRAINNGHMVGTYTTGNGDYVFRVSSASVNAGSAPSWEETMKIGADGIVQKYKHPAFNAYFPAVTSSGDIIICGATRLNEGGHFSTTTGAFTAPVAGVYHFTFAILVDGSGSPDYHRILFEINATGTSTTYGDNLETQASNDYSSAVMSITIYLNQYDYIRIRNQGATTYATNYGAFSGHLVG